MEQNKNREFSDYKKFIQAEMAKLEAQLKDFNFYMGERDQRQAENEQLKKSLEESKKDKMRVLADKEREKIQVTDMMKDGTSKYIQKCLTK